MKIDARFLAAVCAGFVIWGAGCSDSSRVASEGSENQRGVAPPSGDPDEGHERENKRSLEPLDARLKAWRTVVDLDAEVTTLAAGGTSSDFWTNIGPSPQSWT